MLWNQIGSTATTFDIDRYLPDSFDRSLGRAVDASKAVGIEDAPIAPELAYSFENIVSENSITTDRIQLRLNNYFTDESENETLTYSVTATPQGVVNFQPPVNGILTLYGNQVGQATVTITATDKTNLSVSGSFEFIYRDANKPFDLYPLPVKNDILWIRAGLAYQGNVKITMTDSMGKQFYHNDNVVLNILNPTQLNLSKLAPGTYTIEIETKPANTGEGKPVAPKRAKEIFVKL